MIIALQKNLGLKLLALTLSASLWAFVKFTQTPFAPSMSQADVKVPLTVATDPDIVALDAPDSVRLTVRGSEDAIHALKSEDLSAYMDLRGAPQGLIVPQVKVSHPNDISVIGVQPERASIRLDAIVSQTFPIEVKVQGKPANGFKSENPTVTPASASINGAHTYVSQVKHVLAQVNLNALDTSVVQRVSLDAIDDEGNTTNKVEVVPANATISLQVIPEVVPKMLPVFPNVKGTPPNMTLESAWSPRFLRVIFRNSKSATASTLSTMAIDTSALKPGVHKFEAKVVLPEGATLVGGDADVIHLTLHVSETKTPQKSPRLHKSASQ